MKRARLIIKEIQITKQGEIKNFQIKLPKNVKRIIAIETDVRIQTRIDGTASDHPQDGTSTGGNGTPAGGTDGTATTPVRPIEIKQP